MYSGERKDAAARRWAALGDRLMIANPDVFQEVMGDLEQLADVEEALNDRDLRFAATLVRLRMKIAA